MHKLILLIALFASVLTPGAAQPDSVRMDSLIRVGIAHIRKNEVQGRWELFRLIGICRAAGNIRKEAAIWFQMGYATDFPLDSAYISLYSFQQAATLYKKAGMEKEYIQALTYVGDRMIEQGLYDKAENNLLEALAFHKTHTVKIYPDQRYVHFLLAEIYRYKGNYNMALDHGLQIVRIMESTSDSSDAERYYGELAMIYQQLGQPANSIFWFHKTLEKRMEQGFEAFNIFRTAGFMVQEMIQIGQASEALAYIRELQKKYKIQTAAERATLAQSLGYCYEALHQYPQAEHSYLEMIRQFKLSGLSGEFIVISDYDIASYYVRQERYQLAEPYLKHALAETRVWIYLPSSVRDIYFLMYRIDSAQGDYRSGMSHLRQYQLLNDSLVNEKKSKEMAEMLVKYESEKKDKDLLILAKQSQLQKAEIKRDSWLRNMTLGGIALLLIIVGLLFSRYRLQQKSKRQLELSQLAIQRSNTTLQHLVEEKEWLLKEIHHRVKNNLQVIMSLLSSQSVYLDNDAALFAIRDSQRRVQAISLIHQRLYQTENVSAIDMHVYIRELVHYLKESFTDGRHIQFDLSIADLPLDVSQAVPIGLILNEAITNAFKYAFPEERSGTIRIELGQQNDTAYFLNIADNGVGMSSDIMQNREGSLGMSLMQGLSEELGGQFNIISGSDGTLISITFQTFVHE